MYFMPQYNRLYATLVYVSPLFRYLLTIVLVVGLVSSLFFCAYLPLEAHINQYQQSIARMQQQKTQCIQLKRSCAQKEHAIDELRTSLTAYSAQKQTSYDMHVLQHAQQAGLLLGGYTAGSHEDKQWYTLDSARMTFSGDLQQVGRLFDALIQAKIMAVCQKLTLARTQDNRFNVSCDLSFASVKKNPST